MRKKISAVLLAIAIALTSVANYSLIGAVDTAAATTFKPKAAIGDVANFSVKKSAMKALLKWSPASNCDGYRIYRCKKLKGTYKLVAWIKNPRTSQYLDETLTPNSTYYYQMCAMSGKTKGKLTDIKKITTYPNTYTGSEEKMIAASGLPNMKSYIYELSYTSENLLVARIRIKNEGSNAQTISKIKLVVNAGGKTIGDTTFSVSANKLSSGFWRQYRLTFGTKSTKLYTDLKYDEKNISYKVTLK